MEKQECFEVRFRFLGSSEEVADRLIAWRIANGYNVVVSTNINGTGICGLETLHDAEKMATDNQLIITKIELIEDEIALAAN